MPLWHERSRTKVRAFWLKKLGMNCNGPGLSYTFNSKQPQTTVCNGCVLEALCLTWRSCSFHFYHALRALLTYCWIWSTMMKLGAASCQRIMAWSLNLERIPLDDSDVADSGSGWISVPCLSFFLLVIPIIRQKVFHPDFELSQLGMPCVLPHRFLWWTILSPFTFSVTVAWVEMSALFQIHAWATKWLQFIGNPLWLQSSSKKGFWFNLVQCYPAPGLHAHERGGCFFFFFPYNCYAGASKARSSYDLAHH